MKRPVLGALFLVLGCGETPNFNGADGGGSDAKVSSDTGLSFDANAGDGCVNLQCDQTCATTSISGKVYDPAGMNGLYNVFVYVPNAALEPFTDGPTCTQCQATASGNALVSTTTAADGTFSITNVPVGANIPLVLQLGKWRRHLTIPTVTACVDNPQPDGSVRFPTKQHETSQDDNIPLMALTTGCDGAECFFLKRIGLDSSEFSDSKGTGNPNARVRIYKSQYDQGQTFPQVSGSAESAFDLWNTPGEMLKYDIVFDACECSAPDRGGAGTTNTGYINFLGYLNAGGRAFTTHYFYNFFADNTQCDVPFDTTVTCYGQNPLPTVGDWYGNQHLADSPSNCPNESTLPEGGWPNACLTIDTNIPKGKAFADWYQGNNGKLTVGGSEAYGYVGLTDIRQDIGKLDTTLLDAGTATPWLFAGNVSKKYDAYYLTVNTPVGTTPASQCGRAVFSDVHVEAAETTSGAFPSYCPSDPNANDHAPNQLALEFLFFDLSSCVQNDTQPPPPIN